MQAKLRMRLTGALLLAAALAPREAAAQLLEVTARLDVLHAGYLDDGCMGVLCFSRDRTVEAFGTAGW